MPKKRLTHGKKEPLRMVFLGNLEEQSIREACIGAGEYAASRNDLNFEPWPLYADGKVFSRQADFDKIDGVLLTERAHQIVFREARRPGIPYAFFLDPSPHRASAPSAEVDEEMVGAMAAGHLIERGYRILAAIVPSRLGWAELRATGFRKTCLPHSIACDIYRLPPKILPIYWQANLERRHSELSQILVKLPKPCGIFAANDVIACFIIETARSLGLSVPYDVGVIGADNDPMPNAAAGMAISSVQLPFRDLGRWAATLLNQRMQGAKTPKRVVLAPVRVLVRTSTDVFMVENSLVKRAQTYIEQNRQRSLRVGEVIRAIKTTEMTLSKHFRRHLHLTPSRYIMRRRIEYAKELLRSGELNVAEVSEHCNFHNCSYFCMIFKRVTGMNPGRLRRPLLG